MTDDTTARPALYILAAQKNRTIRNGPAFRYMTSAGASLVFNGQRYAASPPKASTGNGESD
jgi:hypothetical protein